MEYLIHYIKFKMWPALSYVNSHCFSHSSIDFKFKFLIVGVRLYLHSPLPPPPPPPPIYTDTENWDIWMLL